jgi:anaerobic magnesium-protoporphyrin IX monomethyl ester cyclase
MAKVIFISPSYIDLYGKISKAAGRYFPLGLGYIASYVRKYGKHEVQIYEPEAQRLKDSDLIEIIKKQDPDIIGLTCSTPNFFRALELAVFSKKHSKAKIVLGGVHATAIPEYIINNYSEFIDFVVVGEGEQTMLELIDSIENKRTANNINGLAFKDGSKVVITKPRDYICDLDKIPFPARDLIPQNLFYPNLHNARYKNCASILTSRGCPFNCTFCAARLVSGKQYRMHSAEYVIDEMEMLKKEYQTEQLLITDDTFTINRNRLEEICRAMIKKKLNLKWFCFSQVNTVNKESLKLMKEAGCFSIGFGVESSDEMILRNMGKNIKPEQALKTINIANKIGLKTQAFYIFGSPGETKEQMQKTIKFSRKVNSTMAFYNMLVPYPGTKDFDFYFKNISLKDINWKNFVAIGEESVLKNAAVSTKEIVKLMANANTTYYLHPKRIFNLLRNIKTFYELKNYILGGLSLFKQILVWSK